MSLPWFMAGSTLGGPLATLGSSALGTDMPPRLRARAYGSNRREPNSLPTPEMIADAHLRGFISAVTAQTLMARNGIVWPRRNVGIDGPGTGSTLAKPDGIDLDDTAFAVYGEAWSQVFTAEQAVPSVGELLTLLNRRHITLPYTRQLLRANNYWSTDMQDLLFQLRNQIPGIPDLVRFAVREVWDDTIARRFNLDAEFPAPFQQWAERVGYGWELNTMPGFGGLPAGSTWAKAYWRAHWELIAPTQAYEMFQRLRPARIERYRRVVPGVQPFTLEDLRAILKVHDYPLGQRDQLAAIAYNKPRLVDIDRMYMTGAVDRAEAVQLHLDYGYDPATAEQRVAWLDLRKRQAALKPVRDANARARRHVQKSTLESFRIGAVSRERAEQILRVVYTGDVTDRRLEARPGPLPADYLAAVDAAIKVELDLVDDETAHARLQALYASVKKRFLRGMLNANAAIDILMTAGFHGPRIRRHVERWQRELDGPRMIFSTAKIQSLVAKGIVPIPSAFAWLTNLGWTEEAVNYMLAESRQQLALQLARAQEKAARTQQQLQAARKRQLAELERERNRIAKQFAKRGTPAQLRQWLILGIIRDSDMLRELLQQGVPEIAARRQLQEARIKRAEYLEKLRGRVAQGREEANGEE